MTTRTVSPAEGSLAGGIAAYVTSHGFGHLNRSVAVINRIPPEVPVAIRCHPDLFDHWRERLTRPASLGPHVSDVGALNPPGDSASTDGPATLARAAEVHARAMLEVDAEARWLAEAGVAVVLADAPPVPLVAASRAGVPGFLLANFTWAEIYAPHALKLGRGAVETVRSIQAAYRHASAVFRAEPALPIRGIAPVIEVGMVVSPGLARREELRELIGLDAGSPEKVVYFYVGRYGQANLDWARLDGYRGVRFVGFHPSPVGPLPNLHVVPATEWTGADLAASSDAIVAKAGYGTACEAMAAGTPIIYPPREGFAEHRALDRALRAWGGGYAPSLDEFAGLRLEPYLDRALSTRPGPAPFPSDGASKVAGHLLGAIESPGRSFRAPS